MLRLLPLALLVACRPGVGVVLPPRRPPEGVQDREWFDERTGERVHEWSERYDADGLPRKEGVERRWWPDGALRAERYWDDGRPTGTWRTFHPDGSPRSLHEHGPLPTPMTFWYPGGQVEAVGLQLEGRKCGEWVFLDPAGGLTRSGPFVDGLEDGVWTLYHPSGALRSRGRYAAGTRVGTWRHWEEREDVRGSDWTPPEVPDVESEPGEQGR